MKCTRKTKFRNHSSLLIMRPSACVCVRASVCLILCESDSNPTGSAYCRAQPSDKFVSFVVRNETYERDKEQNTNANDDKHCCASNGQNVRSPTELSERRRRQSDTSSWPILVNYLSDNMETMFHWNSRFQQNAFSWSRLTQLFSVEQVFFSLGHRNISEMRKLYGKKWPTNGIQENIIHIFHLLCIFVRCVNIERPLNFISGTSSRTNDMSADVRTNLTLFLRWFISSLCRNRFDPNEGKTIFIFQSNAHH